MKLLKDLLQRHIRQILGIYLGASWAIKEFLDWLINQFSISPHLPEFVFLILVFSGKDLRATSSLVTLEDEDGHMVDRVVPKSEFRNKIMLFFLENEADDTALNRLS